MTSTKISSETWKAMLNVDDSEAFNIITTLDLPNQRVIQADVDRTRVGVFTSEEKVDLELLLTFYCKENNIGYKQGMNEIMAPFLLLARERLALHSVYLIFKSFVHAVLGNMFVDNEFRPLQAMFLVYRILLRYHEPRISSFMQLNHTSPECYLTSWILTIFSSKVSDLDALFYIWKEILEEKDQFFKLFISLGLLQHFKTEIVSSSEIGIPYTLNTLQITDLETCKAVVGRAKKLKSQMPYSTLHILSKCNLYDLENIDSLIIELEQLVCVPVLPREIICRSFPESKICPCGSIKCIWCDDHSRDVPLMVIDCRTKERQSQGIVPNSVLLKPEAYVNSDEWLEFPDQFVSMRGIYHFCLLTSFDLKAGDFEFKVVEGRKTDIEENMVLNLIQVFLLKGFQFVSVVQGGYLKVHDFAKLFELQLDSHTESSCFLCDPNCKVKREARSNTSGDIERIYVDVKATYAGNSQKSKVVEKEMQGCCSVIFFCKVQKDQKNLDYCIKISEEWFEARPSENEGDLIKANTSLLSNITIMKKNPLSVSFSFKDTESPIVLLMKSREEVKKCVGQVSTFFHKTIEKRQSN